jgi:hypothetical protein
MSLSHAAQLSVPASHVGTLIRPGMFAAFAEFERRLMLERQRAGIAKAKSEGKYKGRKPTARAKADQVKALAGQGVGPSDIARKLGIVEARSIAFWNERTSDGQATAAPPYRRLRSLFIARQGDRPHFQRAAKASLLLFRGQRVMLGLCLGVPAVQRCVSQPMHPALPSKPWTHFRRSGGTRLQASEPPRTAKTNPSQP